MNKRFLVAFPLALLISSCSGQGISRNKVPSIVQNTLNAQYPNMDKAEWEKHGDVYEAEFDINDTVEMVVRIDEAGKLVMKKEDISTSELPSGVTAAIQNQKRDFVIDDVEKIEKDGIVYYQVELKTAGKKEVNLVFSADGREEKSIIYWD